MSEKYLADKAQEYAYRVRNVSNRGFDPIAILFEMATECYQAGLDQQAAEVELVIWENELSDGLSHCARALRAHRCMTPAGYAKLAGIEPNAAQQRLRRLTKQKIAKRQSQGHYEWVGKDGL